MNKDTVGILGEIPVLGTGVGKLQQFLCDIFHAFVFLILEERQVLGLETVEHDKALTFQLTHLREVQTVDPFPQRFVIHLVTFLS